tara:strand:+ start:265 stop:1362 length:1098 start_codon:yes stop_codon:yes gene_type:complete
MGLLTNFKQNDVFRDEHSLAFDGSNDYVELSGAFNYTVHSISIWVKEASISGASSLFDYRDANNDGIHIYLADGKPLYQNNNADGYYNSALTLNQWHHIVCTNDGSTSTIYVNGVAVETADTSGETISVGASTVARIGCRSHTSPDNYFNGNISEVAFYTSALTINQVKTIYNGREPYNHKEGVASGNLQAWYRMGDGALDGFDSKENGLIQSHNSQLQSSIVTSWTNASAGFNTLNATGTNITSMINNDSGTDNVRSNSLTVATTDTYKVSFDIAGTTIPSSINKLMLKVSPNNALNSATYDGSVTGAGSYVFYVQPQTTTIYVGFRAVEDVDCNVTNFKMQKITNNSGLMKNMTATDIEGDTP